MKMKRHLAGPMLIAGVLVLLAGCGGSTDSTDQAGPSDQTEVSNPFPGGEDNGDKSVSEMMQDQMGPDEGLPDAWPDDISIPEQTSDVTGRDMSIPQSIELLVHATTDASWDTLLGFYQQELSGWKQDDLIHDAPSLHGNGNHVEFTNGDREFELGLYPAESGEMTDLQLHYYESK